MNRLVYWKNVSSHISKCLALCDSYISNSESEIVLEYLEHNELGLAIESLIDIAMENDWELPISTRREILQTIEIMDYQTREKSIYEIYRLWAEGT